jgi:hypothetical protein
MIFLIYNYYYVIIIYKKNGKLDVNVKFGEKNYPIINL